jgi:hypothetical protein
MNADPQQVLRLRDIHLPPTPSLWPPAPGWWAVAALILALLVWAGVALWKQERLRRRRQRVVDALTRLESGLATERSVERLASISVLLRRLALTRFPREQIAVLSGDAWLRFLDESGGNGRFADGPGRVLADGPYRRTLPADLDITGFVALVREWVDKNTRGIA